MAIGHTLTHTRAPTHAHLQTHTYAQTFFTYVLPMILYPPPSDFFVLFYAGATELYLLEQAENVRMLEVSFCALGITLCKNGPPKKPM